MKFVELLDRIPATGLFRTGDILAGERKPADVRRQLDRWRKLGRVMQLRREVYLVEPPFRRLSPHPFGAANLLRRASYISLQSALSYYGMIPEHVPMTTSVTGGRPEELETPLGRFLFRHVSGSRFFGFAEREIAPGQTALVATPEKALLDLLYLTPGSDDWDFLNELRIELPENFDRQALSAMGERMKSQKVSRASGMLFDQWKRKERHETPAD